jgi:archaeal type IV pilus assembly protein PilA
MHLRGRKLPQGGLNEMKKIWKIRKDSKAVSPVIATILMVAITVVLAAVLYVMVMGFGGSDAQTPTGSFGTKVNQGDNTWWVYMGVISPSTNWDECKLSVGGTLSAALTKTALGNLDGISFNVTDLANDDRISNGDYIILEDVPTGTTNIALVYIETGGTICSTTITA